MKRARITGAVLLALVVTAVSGYANSKNEFAAALSAPPGAEVRYKAYVSLVDLMSHDRNGQPDIYVRDLRTNQVELVSVDNEGVPGPGPSTQPAISGDGRFVAFVSRNALVAEDTDSTDDVYMYDRRLRRMSLVSRGVDDKSANALCAEPVFAWEGNYLAYTSVASNLVVGDRNGRSDVFLWNRQTRQTTRISVTRDGAELADASFDPAISPGGVYIGFRSKTPLFPPPPGSEGARIDGNFYYVVQRDGRGGKPYHSLWLVDSRDMSVLMAVK